AFAAAAPRVARVEGPLYAFLTDCLGNEKPALLRVSAANALGSSALNENQLGSLTQAIAKAGALELPKLLGAYERSSSGKVGQRLVDALGKAPAIESLSAEALRRTLKSYPEEIRKA